jgi:hypothetical protein
LSSFFADVLDCWEHILLLLVFAKYSFWNKTVKNAYNAVIG